MTACEKCWTDAYPIARTTGRPQAEVYHELVNDRGDTCPGAGVYQACRCCGESVLPQIAGSYPDIPLCDDCGRGKCADCIDEVRALWKGATNG